MEGISGSSKREAGSYQGKRGGKDNKGRIKLTAESLLKAHPTPGQTAPSARRLGTACSSSPACSQGLWQLAAVQRKLGGLGRALDKLMGEKRKGCEWEGVAYHKHLCKRG